MTAREEASLVRRWRQYCRDKPVTNKILVSFYRDEVRSDPKLRHVTAFEVLDSITNAPIARA
ncbi:MAG: hypothetical protein AAF648_17175 [Pseudomonadota bacterium]